MTAAGVGSLLICQRQLARYRRGGDVGQPVARPARRRGPAAAGTTSSLSNAQDRPGGQARDRLARGQLHAPARTRSSASRPITPSTGSSGSARLANRDTLGRVDWFDQGRQFIRATQRGDGAWDATYGDVPNTVWAILFLTKSTAKTLARIEVKPLGAGTLLGGRGLPKDLRA